MDSKGEAPKNVCSQCKLTIEEGSAEQSQMREDGVCANCNEQSVGGGGSESETNNKNANNDDDGNDGVILVEDEEDDDAVMISDISDDEGSLLSNITAVSSNAMSEIFELSSGSELNSPTHDAEAAEDSAVDVVNLSDEESLPESIPYEANQPGDGGPVLMEPYNEQFGQYANGQPPSPPMPMPMPLPFPSSADIGGVSSDWQLVDSIFYLYQNRFEDLLYLWELIRAFLMHLLAPLREQARQNISNGPILIDWPVLDPNGGPNRSVRVVVHEEQIEEFLRIAELIGQLIN